MDTGSCQVLPSYTRAWFEKSTAMQKVVRGHETALKEGCPSIASRRHRVPSYVSATPCWSRATQKADVAQEIATGLPPGSTLDGFDHAAPSKVNTLPVASITAQKADDTHEIPVG